MEYFYSVKNDIIFKTKIKRSVFIAHLHYATTIAEAKIFISKISSEHKNANHNCWAYIVGDRGQTFHSSDAGEPSGTAGQPMLNALKKSEMTNIVVVVTRYFGGVKLGIRGLIEAYSESVDLAIKSQKLLKLVKLEIFKVTTSYSFAEIFKFNAEQMQAKIINAQYSEVVLFDVEIEQHLKEKFFNYLQELSGAGKLKIINPDSLLFIF